MKAFRLNWQVNEHQSGLLLRDFLKRKHISKSALADIKYKGGRIYVNRQEVTVRYTVLEGDYVEVVFPVESPSEGLIADYSPLKIVYEDDYVLIINKPAYTNTIPSREHPTGSIANLVVGYYEQNKIPSTVHVVTRLDRDTSGLMLIAKHRHIHHLLSEQQKTGHVSRIYEALVHGLVVDSNIIEAPIGRKSTSIIEREVRSDGQYTSTMYKPLARYSDFTHIELSLQTGRTHQIRVHMSYLGHPLLGDDLYGGTLEKINRQALHCKKLSFYHPFKREILTIEAEMAEDMKRVIEL